MNKQYFIIRNDVQQGPFTLEELSKQGIVSETLVWTEGMPQWAPAWQVEELKPLLNAHATATPPPPPYSAPNPQTPPPGYGAQQPYQGPQGGYSPQQPSYAAQPAAPQKRSSHIGLWALVGMLIAVSVAMVVSNPSRQAHADIIKENVRRGITRVLTGDDGGLMARGLGKMSEMITGPIVDEVVDQQVEYHNKLLWSTTTISDGQKDVTVSYGLFGKVFTAGEEQIAAGITKELGGSKSDSHSSSNNLIGNDDAPANDNAVSDEQNSNADAEENTPDDNADESLSKVIGNAIIDHLGNKLKQGVRENTDSTVSRSVGSLIDDVMKMMKK